MESEIPEKKVQDNSIQKEENTETQSVSENEPAVQDSICTITKDPCLSCSQLKMDLKASQDRNQILFSQFASSRYRSSVEATISLKENEISRLQLANEAQEKEIQSLKSIVDELNKKLLEKEEKQHENDILVAKMKDDLAIEQNKNSEISTQYIGLQFKLAQEKAVKSIKATASSISSTIKSISQDLLVKKPEPLVLNEGYSQFVKKYEEDMKRIDKTVRDLEVSYQQVVHDWAQYEEEHKKKETELLQENEQLRKEKNEIEKTLRSSLQSMESSNQDLQNEIVKIRLQYKVSDQEENNTLIESLRQQVKKTEEEKEKCKEESDKQIDSLSSQVNEMKDQIQNQEEKLKEYEKKIEALNPNEEKEKERVLQRINQWQEETHHFDSPGFEWNDPSVQGLFDLWNVDENTKQVAKQWLSMIMTETKSPEVKEFILPSLSVEIYNGFIQVILPILQTKFNTSIKAFFRQSVVYDLKLTIVEEVKVEQPILTPKTPIEEANVTEKTEVEQKKKKKWLWND